VLLADAIRSNAQYFPSCAQNQVDGQLQIPQACAAAIVGTGTASFLAGSPGTPAANSVREDMTIKLMNGSPAGSTLWMIVNSSPSAPVAITNRVLAGTISPATSPYGLALKFQVPPDLQSQLGLAITFTDLDVTISGATRAVTTPGGPAALSFLQATGCGNPLPFQSAVSVKDKGTAQLKTLNFQGTTPCIVGAFAGFPLNSAPPSVTGIPRPGQTLTCSQGTWAGPMPQTYAYQWYRDATAVEGATSATFAVKSSDVGHTLTCAVTASNDRGSASALSSQVSVASVSGADLSRLLGLQIPPSGKGAKIGALLRKHGYAMPFTAPVPGKLTVSWFYLPKGAQVSTPRPVLLARGARTWTTPETLTLHLTLTGAGARMLQHSKRLQLTATALFAPQGSSSVKVVKRFVVRR